VFSELRRKRLDTTALQQSSVSPRPPFGHDCCRDGDGCSRKPTGRRSASAPASRRSRATSIPVSKVTPRVARATFATRFGFRLTLSTEDALRLESFAFRT
jgi:hypothetical protein